MVQYNYYLGPWVWDASDPVESFWRPPTGSVGSVDLASLPDLGSQRGSPRKIGFFAANAILGSDYALLGQGDCRDIPADVAMQSAWKAATGYAPTTDGKLVDMLADHLMHGCDPQGLDACLPLVPTIDRLTEIHLGGHSVVWQQKFVWDNGPHCNRLKALLQRDLIACRAAALAGKMGLRGADQAFHRQILQGVLEKYQITFDDIRPAQWPKNETPLPHQTTITESFDKADSTTLGPDLTWTEVLNDLQIKSNQATIVTTGARCDARAQTDLSSADHYSQIDIVTLDYTGSTQRQGAAHARFDSSADTAYVFFVIANQSGVAADDRIQLSKLVTGASTTIAGPTTETETIPATIKCQASGSTISALVGGVSKLSVTDTAISGNTRCGFNLRGDVAGTSIAVDNFQAADLAAAGILYTQLERSTRGILRGVYTHF